MKHKNISIFIPHVGCKNSCSFCNQRVISGQIFPPTKDEVRDVLNKAFNEIEDKNLAEIAFFGGSFTAIDREYMLDLLEVANEFIGKDKFFGIRVSTRPDAISQEILDILKKYNVTAIELGAQSMVDEVLTLNDRGHTVADIFNASKLIKANGFSLGLQMMVGLYGDTVEGAYNTANQIIKIKPDTVRIYPTVVLKNTKLASLYNKGQYKIMPLEMAVSLCADLLLMFQQNDIKVIKLGLHASDDVKNDMVSGIYHEAFRELCENEIFYKLANKQIEKFSLKDVIIEVSPRCISKMIGQNKKNVEKFKQKGYNVKVVANTSLNNFDVVCKLEK